jgi:hypothetical protein
LHPLISYETLPNAQVWACRLLKWRDGRIQVCEAIGREFAAWLRVAGFEARRACLSSQAHTVFAWC